MPVLGLAEVLLKISKYVAAMAKRRALVGIVVVWIVSRLAFGFLYAPTVYVGLKNVHRIVQ